MTAHDRNKHDAFTISFNEAHRVALWRLLSDLPRDKLGRLGNWPGLLEILEPGKPQQMVSWSEITEGDDMLHCEYGTVKGTSGFYFWFIGGENFGSYAGEFEGPFDTLEIAKSKAEEIGKKENLEVRLSLENQDIKDFDDGVVN